MDRAPVHPTASTPTVMVVEDDAAFASHLVKFVERRCGAAVVDTASNAEDAIERVERLRPSFILLDICMSGMTGLEAIAFLRSRSPESAVIVVSSMPVEYGTEAVRLGARAYVQKDRVVDELPELLTI